MLDRDFSHGILTLRLAHGKASALDLELCETLRSEFESVAGRDDVRVVILTGTGSIFCAGVDLPRLINSGGDYVPRLVKALDDLLRTLFVLPKPVIAAINGHAIAGGAMLAFACDYRLMSSGRIGVPEMLVGVPFPALALEIVRFAVPPHHLQSLLYLGRTVETDDALTLGIVDETPEITVLMTRALKIAEHFASLAPEAFAMTKRQIREPYLHPPRTMVDGIWGAAETHQRIRAYLERTIGKK
ncbi:MAG TPA: enoyl-CoA hydratase/isomerase family protein [Thermoanaerobaculia bacterium]|nr:enoyl-CoA hydratase/isomerase family protein [Thermoanaerobaculia bacterium]